MNAIFKNSLFLPEGVKIDFENTKHASDVKGGKWKRTAKIPDYVFWLRQYQLGQIHQELLATLGSDPYSEDSVQYWVACFQSGNLATWQTSYRFGGAVRLFL
jgi:hypothetical protein